MNDRAKKIVSLCIAAAILAVVIFWISGGFAGKKGQVAGTWKGAGVSDTIVFVKDGTYMKSDNFASTQKGRYLVDRDSPQADYAEIQAHYANHSYYVNGEYRQGQEYEGFYIAFYKDGSDAMTGYGLLCTSGDMKGNLQTSLCPSWMSREE